jgi:glutaredoxin
MEVIVYSALWCPDGGIAKRFLAKHRVPYKEIDTETTSGAA